MKVFRRRTNPAPALPTTGHAGDDALLGQSAAQSNLDTTRHWIHYLYVQDEAQARSAAQVISAAGWGIQNVDEAAGDAPGWVVIAERQAVTSPSAIRDARLFFEGVAATHEGGDYDGWEASLELRSSRRTTLPLSRRSPTMPLSGWPHNHVRGCPT